MIRKSIFAGHWYPTDKKELEKLLVCPERSGNARLAVLPHAGLYFSHRGISQFFANLAPGITRIVVLSPSHYYYLQPNAIHTADFSSYETPLGDVPGFELKGFVPGGEKEVQAEHAVEMVLPYIAQKGSLRVSIGLISQVDDPKPLVDVLLPQLDEHTAVIASSDFTHYGARFDYIPYGRNVIKEVLDKVKRDDLALSDLLARGDCKEALAFVQERQDTVCGIAACLIVSSLAKKLGLKGTVADYYTSYDIESDGDSFVAYSTILWG
ncbi:MAG: AmmeMemoRadiSam system protein B [Sphaerochaetaceae bacterium]